MEEKVRNQNLGITLIALVITIVVLLILAGVSIAMLTGENGILTQANRAKKETIIASEKEKIELSLLEANMDDTSIEAFENALNKYIGEGKYKLTGRETFVVTIYNTDNSYRINNNKVENIENYEEGSMYVTLYKDGTLAFSSANSTLNEKEVVKEFGNLQGKGYSEINKAPWLETDEYTNMIEKVMFLDEIKPISTQCWFQNCINLQGIENIGNLNAENITSFCLMFGGCSQLKELDLSNIDASKATDMRWMFANCSNLTSLNLNNFNAGKVSRMTQIFLNCKNLVDLNIKGFNTSNVSDMLGMFYNCYSLKNIDLAELNTSNVTSMESMFEGCTVLTNINFKGFNTSRVINMKKMFSSCTGLTTLDLSYLDTSNVEDMQDMFYDCSNLTSINLNGFNTSKVENMYRMFSGCGNLENLDLSHFNTNNVNKMSDMFYGNEKLKTIYVSDLWSIDNVVEGNNLFVRCMSLVGAIPFNSEKLDVAYANYTDGYFTFKEITNN